jgi:ribonuclease P protein component
MPAAHNPPSGPTRAAADQRFRGHQHIRQRAEFQQVYDRGRKHQGRFMLVFTLPRDGQQPARLGIAATRKLGKAVERNRAKRLVRELFRRHPAPPGVDIVVVPRRPLIDASYASLEAEYVATLGRLRPRSAAR